jgi:hypothetical protein
MSKAQLSFSSVCFQGKWKSYWEIKSVVDHTCVLELLDASHRNLSSGFVASQMFAKIVENPAYEPKSIILAIEEKFRYQISYGKACKEEGNGDEVGTYEASYDNLPRLLNTIATLNPGSYYDIKTYNLVSRPGKQVLQRVFLALGPAIAAFKQCWTSYLHRWHILNRKIQGHNPYSCGCRWQQSVVAIGNCFCRGREW